MVSLYHPKLAAASAFDAPVLLPRTLRPTLANVNLTENCQAKCVTCDYWKGKFKNYITTDRAISLLKELREIGARYLRVTGGEPLLRKDLLEILNSTRDDPFERVTIATNGLLLPRFKDQINDSVVTNLTVSLDAVGAVNDRIRGIKGYYQNAIDILPHINKKIKVVSTFTKDLVPSMEELILLCKERGYNYDVNLPDKEMYFFASEETRAIVDEMWPSEEDIEKGMAILKKHDILPQYLLKNARTFLTTRRFEFNHCILGYFEVIIDSKGDVRSGCNVFEAVGNALETHIGEVINSQAYKDTSKKMYDLDCPLCTCGYGISAVYKKPWHALGYINRRRQ